MRPRFLPIISILALLVATDRSWACNADEKEVCVGTKCTCVPLTVGNDFGNSGPSIKHHNTYHHAPPVAPSAVVPPPSARPTKTIASSQARITDSGYDFLYASGGERDGYGLYTYALMTSADAERSKAFFSAITSTTPEASLFGNDIKTINVIYLPFSKPDGTDVAVGEPVTRYNYGLARVILNEICQSDMADLRDICSGSLSYGPYLFTYYSKLDAKDKLAPPALFVDLTSVHQKAFSTYIDAYKAQVKREDISDKAKIEALSLKLLSILLDASDILPPVKDAVAGIVHPAGIDKAKDDGK